jgi:uncharacterized protein (DUF58 family)
MTPEEVTHEVRRIEITTRHLVRDIVAGEYSSAFRGRGVEFSEVREYQPGDDIRTIDWNVTARLGAAYVKRYLEERELTVMFVVDFSASGGFGSRLRKGRRHVLRVISDILSFEPAGRGTDLAAALGELEPTLRRRAVIFLLSDFLASGYEGPLARLSRRHDLVALQLVDPRERELPDAGVVTLWDPERGGWRRVDTSDLAVREGFRTRALEFDRTLERGLRERGADLLRLETGRSYAEPLLAFFRRRERMLWR